MNRDIWDYVFRFESYDYVSRLKGYRPDCCKNKT